MERDEFAPALTGRLLLLAVVLSTLVMASTL